MDYTPHQQNIIKRYYDHREDIAKQRLSELVTELYLAEGKKRQQVWKRIAAALSQLGIKPDKIEQMVNTDNPVQLAEFLNNSGRGKR
ncbi:MAG: hypothetical protein FWG73_04525 [Planctomycetaceae bacterium]|nr:hypothetical protein [Planctomycetaceae bacterium]